MQVNEPPSPRSGNPVAGESPVKPGDPAIETPAGSGRHRKIVVALVAAILAAILAAGGLFYSMVPQEKAAYQIEKTIRYSFQVTNKSAQYIDSASLKVFAPVSQNSYQKVEKITANKSFVTRTDQSGNQSLLFRLKGLAPHATQMINITAKVKLAGSPQPYRVEEEGLLVAETNIEVGAREVIELAGKLNGEAQEITLWLYKNVTDIGYISEDRGARYAITERQGDCTEFASAFVALARASKVPSRMIGGFTLQNSGKLQAKNYHNWAEYKRDTDWGIADPQHNIVDKGYGSYIAFYNFDIHSRLENSQRFLSYDQRLKVQML